MKNIEGLSALNLMLNLADRTENGFVPLSKYKLSEDSDKIIYDDSKPEKDDYYPIVFYDADHKAFFSYDSLLTGVTVRCRVIEGHEDWGLSSFITFTAKDEAENSVEFFIDDGHIYFSELNINTHLPIKIQR